MRLACLPIAPAMLFSLSTALLLGATACSSDGASTAASSTSGGGVTCPESLAKAADSEFCENDGSTIDCDRVTPAYTSRVCGVAMIAPTKELARSSTVKEYGGTGDPDLGCFAPGGYPAKPDPSKSQMVKVSGVAKIFSNGCESKDLKIEIFPVKRSSGADDGDVGALIGAAVTTASDCKMGVMVPDPNCTTRYECTYEYDGVPTETELVIRTSGSGWAPLYEYNDFIPAAEVMNGVWKHDVRALSADDYNVIPVAAGNGPVTAGNGVIAGEVHDCGDVRLHNAVVDLSTSKRILSYFSNDELHPLPDNAARETSTLGLYAAFDVKPGPVTVAAEGLVKGQVTTVGYFRARVFPDAVTAVTFHGLRPFQVP